MTTPLSDRDSKRFGLAVLEANGIEAHVWDLSSLYYPDARHLLIESPAWVRSSTCSTVEDLQVMCEQLTASHVVIFINALSPEHTWWGRRLLRLVSSTSAKLATITVSNLPEPHPQGATNSNFVVRIRRLLKLLSRPHGWLQIYRRFAVALFGTFILLQRRLRVRNAIRPLDHVWAGTQISGVAPCHLSSATTVTFIHNLDYDLVLQMDTREEPDRPYMVFLDQMGPLHPDFLILGRTYGVDMQTYSALICRGLSQIEEHLGIETVVAVHPRATPGLMEAWYGGRPLVYNDTANAIANAEIVVTQASTSVGIAAVFERPIVLMNSSKFFVGSQMYSQALMKVLNADFLDLDATEFVPPALQVDRTAYQHYVHSFVKRPGTPEISFWSIVAKEIVSVLFPKTKLS